MIQLIPFILSLKSPFVSTLAPFRPLLACNIILIVIQSVLHSSILQPNLLFRFHPVFLTILKHSSYLFTFYFLFIQVLLKGYLSANSTFATNAACQLSNLRIICFVSYIQCLQYFYSITYSVLSLKSAFCSIFELKSDKPVLFSLS